MSIGDASRQHLSFRAAGEEYAVEILRVREITQLAPLTRLPTAPPAVRGVMNLRGTVVPVVDLAVRFGLGETQITRFTCVVLVEVAVGEETAIVGVLADSVSQVIELRPEDVEPPPSFGTKVRPEHLVGVGKLGPKLVLLLDLERVLAGLERVDEPEPEPEAPPDAPSDAPSIEIHAEAAEGS